MKQKQYKGVPIKQLNSSIQVSTERFELKPLYGNNGLRCKAVKLYVIDLDIPSLYNNPLFLSELKHNIDTVINEKDSPRKSLPILASYIESYLEV